MKANRFFRIIPPNENLGDWFLDDPRDSNYREVDSRIFTRGKYVNMVGPLIIPQMIQGNEVDFSLASFQMPVVKHIIGDIIAKIAPESVQRIPATIEPNITSYEILNVIRTVPCLDEDKSIITRWKNEDGRPEKIGCYSGISKYILNGNKLHDVDIFRLDGWTIALFVSNRIRLELESVKLTGIYFEDIEVANYDAGNQ